MKKVFALLLCLVLVFSVTGTFVAVEGGEEQYPQESFSVVEKNLITGEEATKTFEMNEIEEALIDNEVINQLPDFGEEMIMPYGIIGDDERQIVEDTTAWPHSAVAYIRIDWPGLRSTTRGTAWLISDNVAVTAGHNLYDPYDDVWASGVYIYPGKDGFGISNDPFGATYAESAGVSLGWSDSGSGIYDWGLIILKEKCDEDIEFLDYVVFSQENEVNDVVRILGYPSINKLLPKYKQYESYGKITSINEYLITHNADTSGGNSGSPVLDGNNKAIAIHTGGDNGDGEGNTAIKISEEMCYYFNNTIRDNE